MRGCGILLLLFRQVVCNAASTPLEDVLKASSAPSLAVSRQLAGSSSGGSSGYVESETVNTIHLVENMEMWEQRMTQEFLLVVYGYDVDVSKEHLRTSIRLFDEAFHELETGNAAKLIMKPPNSGVVEHLASIALEWKYYKGLLEKNYNLLLNHQKSFLASDAAELTVADAIKSFKQGWDSLNGTTQSMQAIYNNEDSSSSGPEAYHMSHEQYHSHFRALVLERGYTDLLLADMEGNVIYSVHKNPDFATNIHPNGTNGTGPVGQWANSGIGDAFEAAVNHPDQINVGHWAQYWPGGNVMTNFLSTGIVQDDTMVGVMVAKLPPAAQATGAQLLDLTYVEKNNYALLQSLEMLLKRYKSYAELSGSPLPATDSAAARKQLLTIEQIMKDALFATLDMKRSYYLDALYNAETKFAQTHESLLWGDPVANIPEMNSLCSLHSMFIVSKDLQLVQKYMRRVRHMKAVKVPMALVSSIARVGYHLEHAMADATGLIEHYDDSCDVVSNMSSTIWKNGVKESVKQRYLVQKVSRLFFKIALGIEVESNKISVIQAVADAQQAMRTCAKGSVSADVQPPPTQEIVDIMAISWHEWLTFSAELIYGVQTNDFSARIVEKLAHYSYVLDKDLDIAAKLYIKAADTYYPAVRPTVLGTSQKQLVFLHKMLKEAALVSLGEDVEFNRKEFANTKKGFEKAHWWLLEGRAASGDDYAIPRTVDACTLTAMEPVLGHFQEVRKAGEDLMLIAEEQNSSKTYNAIKYLDKKFALTYGEMSVAAQMYITGNNTCNTRLSRLVWEVAIDKTGQLPFMFQQAQTKLALLVDGLSDYWKNQTYAALGKQKDSTRTESASAQLEEMFNAFHSGWDTFRGTDDERRLGLQVAYITLNNNSEENRQMLDFASGTSEYHVAHRRWHPTYRSILQEQNYYDIFLLDLNGNCIYSVNKKLDFATNFAADGTGRWKTSGLGEAFRASVTDPDGIHVTSWAPYGPNRGAMASFVSTGIKRKTDGALIGVYVTQMQPETRPVDSLGIMMKQVNEMQTLIRDFKFGHVSEHIYPPSFQKVSDALLAISDRWDILDPLFRGTRSFYTLRQIMEQNDAFVAETDLLEVAYIDGAYQEDPTLPGAKMHLASRQLVLLQSMCKEVVLLDIAAHWKKSSAAELESHKEFALYEAAQDEVIVAIGEFKDAWTAFAGSDDERRLGLQTAYMGREDLTSANGSETYHAVHGSFHPVFKQILHERNYYDIFLFNLEGNCIYSVHKGLDYATNFAAGGSGQWKDSGLGEAYRGAIQSPDSVTVIDWAPYGPADGHEASFLATGVKRDGTLIGVLATELPTAAKPDDFGVSKTHLQQLMAYFEDNDNKLLRGTASRRLAGGSDIAATTSQAGRDLLNAVKESWNQLKKPLQDVVDGELMTKDTLKNVVDLTDAAVSDMKAATTFFSSTTRTTTKVLLEILSPIPFTGEWAAGATLRVGALLAESLINEQQVILPGYELKHSFHNDQCDPSMSTQIVLGEMSAKDSYIGFAGGGCSKVCAQTVSVTSSIRLPFLSYDCPGAELSDALTYPDLTRMGTVTTPFPNIIRNLANQWGWSHIFVISGDPTKYRAQATEYMDAFKKLGFGSEYVYAFDSEWDEINSMMSQIKEKTKGKDRAVFVLGTETYFRKVICASITAGLNKGIVWMSQGTWRSEWWKRDSMETSFHRQWLKEDTLGTQLRQAFTAFKRAWDQYGASVDQTRTAIQGIYVTSERDARFFDGPEDYHGVHTLWHPVYRKILNDRKYADIFMFDTNGDLIYSVNKENDYATNIKTGAWKDSGLGDAFRAAMAKPEDPFEVSYIDFKPYGPSGDAPAAFFSRGIWDNAGNLIGVYAIRLPSDFEKSIELVQPECTLDAIAEAYEGAINIAGLGQPTDENMVKPLPCFEGHSPRSLISLLDSHLKDGYPKGDLVTQVEGPYHDVKTRSMDATCALAFTVRHMLDQGYTAEEIQRPDATVYEAFNTYLRTGLDFPGLSGHVKFEQNDRPNYLSVQQVQNGKSTRIGLMFTNSTITWEGTGADNSSWAQEPKDPPQKFEYALVFQIGIPAIVISVSVVFGLRMGYRLARARQSGLDSKMSSASGRDQKNDQKNGFDAAALGLDVPDVDQVEHVAV